MTKGNEVKAVESSVREVINKTKKENVNKIKRGKRAKTAIQKEKVLGKSVDEWLAFAVSSSVTDYTQELSKNVDEIIREVENWGFPLFCYFYIKKYGELTPYF